MVVNFNLILGFSIILPRGQWVTRLVVKHYHKLSNQSAGTNCVLSQISGRFWIVAAGDEIRAWENECSEYKRCRNKPATQIMGPLPQLGLHFKFCAFDHTTLDYAYHYTRTWASVAKEVVVCFHMLIDSCSSSQSCTGALI